jgi:hypothetical protein
MRYQEMKIPVYIVCALLVSAAWGAAKPQDPNDIRLEEGFFLDGAQGILLKDAATDTWMFRPAASIELPKEDFPAGKALPMLPCSVLEQMTQMADIQMGLHVRLWAMATKHRHTNYLYAVFFMPLKDMPAVTTSDDSPQDQPQDDSIIPADILRQIKNAGAPDLHRFQQVAQVTGDINLIGRAGYLQKRNGQDLFVPDAFGQNIERWQFVVLPSASMESAEREMNKMPGRQRFTVSGLVTMYKGQAYILLRRAERTFTHGNFTQ